MSAMLQSDIIDEPLTDPEALLDVWLQPEVNGTDGDPYADNGTAYSANVSAGAPSAPAFRHALVYLPIQIVVSFAAVVANLLTLLAMSRVRTKQPYLILVVNLTISDMLFGLRNVIIRGVVLGFEFDYKLKHWFDDICVRGLIRVAGSAIYTCTYMNLLAIAFDLYFAIMKPFRYQKSVTRRRTIVGCVFLWLLSVCVAAANYWATTVHYFVRQDNSTFCQIRSRYKMYDVYAHLFVVYAGMLAMTFLYVKIFIEVRRCSRCTPGLPVKTQQKVKHNTRKLATSLLVLLTFLVAWLPNGIFTTLFFVLPNFGGTTITLLGMYMATLPMLNSLCDPVIYAIRLEKVRLGFRKLCHCSTRRWHRDSYVSESTEMMNITLNSAPENRIDLVEMNDQTLLANKPDMTNGDFRPQDGDDI